jgi:hypothetical protein
MVLLLLLLLLLQKLLHFSVPGRVVVPTYPRAYIVVVAAAIAPALLLQKLLRSAYQGALSYPLIPELEDLHRINSHVLEDFVAQHYTGAYHTVHTLLSIWGIS